MKNPLILIIDGETYEETELCSENHFVCHLCDLRSWCKENMFDYTCKQRNNDSYRDVIFNKLKEEQPC